MLLNCSRIEFFLPFNYSMSPKVSCEVISGLPPIDIYCSAIDIKFLIKSVCEDDLVHKEHKLGLNRSRSLANITESKLKRYSRQHTPTSYTRASIQSYFHDIWNKRWMSPHNDTFLKTFVEDIPVDLRFSPMIQGNPYIANKITEFAMGNSLLLKENLWKVSRIASPLCECLKSEENSYHFLFCCEFYNSIRPHKLHMANIFVQDDCTQLKNFLADSHILNRMDNL